ncbi:MAG: cytochrome c [Flavobacteriaceae bacterium]|nr:cytochrome c [Flavobacteriaceae bacterium]
MKSFTKIAIVVVAIFTLVSCVDKKKRQLQYMADTDMYTPVGYETYGENADGEASVRKPVDGTIARGQVPYDYPNSQLGYEAARDSLQSPLKIKVATDSIATVSENDLQQGKYLYCIYCAACHGAKGEGQGSLAQNGKILGVPNYKDREITEGSIYHVLMYGKGIMGSHSSQINATERWQITHYVEQLRNDLIK